MCDSYLLPLIDDCLEHIKGKLYFTILDLVSSFHQIKVSNIPVINYVLQSFIKEGSFVDYMDDRSLLLQNLCKTMCYIYFDDKCRSAIDALRKTWYWHFISQIMRLNCNLMQVAKNLEVFCFKHRMIISFILFYCLLFMPNYCC